MVKWYWDLAVDPTANYWGGGEGWIKLIWLHEERLLIVFFSFNIIMIYLYLCYHERVVHRQVIGATALLVYRRATRRRLPRFHKNTEVGNTCCRKHVCRKPNVHRVRSDGNSHGRRVWSRPVCGLCIFISVRGIRSTHSKFGNGRRRLPPTPRV